MWGSLAAASPAIAAGASARPASAATSNLLVRDLEVATVSDTSVVITWFTGSATAVDSYGFPEPVAADTELQIGSVDPATLTVVPGSMKTVFHDTTRRRTTTPR
jgi:3',5'-cyclic-AMP phosphodiesterase